MNTIQKFERFKTSVFNAQDILKNHILNKNPVIYTNDTNDYSQATKYSDVSECVWIVHTSVKLDKDFPLWLKLPGSQLEVAYEFPYVFKQTKNVKSWGLVKLVPTTGTVNTLERKSVICGYYDVFNGHDSFDKFFLGNETDILFKQLKTEYTNVYAVPNARDAFEKSSTDMFWIIPKNIKIADDFKFDLVPSERAYEYPHVFGNGDMNNHSGIVLMSKAYTPTERELDYNFYVKKRIIKKVISTPL